MKQRQGLVEARVKEKKQAEETRVEQIRELQMRITKATNKLRRVEKEKQRVERKLNDQIIGYGSDYDSQAEEEDINQPSLSCCII